MPGIDQTRPFLAVRIALLTVSDTRDALTDKSGDLLAERIGPGASCAIKNRQGALGNAESAC